MQPALPLELGRFVVVKQGRERARFATLDAALEEMSRLRALEGGDRSRWTLRVEGQTKA